jgi:hypothetical protein
MLISLGSNSAANTVFPSMLYNIYIHVSRSLFGHMICPYICSSLVPTFPVVQLPSPTMHYIVLFHDLIYLVGSHNMDRFILGE